MIEKIKFRNFKIFKDNEIVLNSSRNILIGANGVGKSTIVQAIALVLSGSINQISSIGLESLFNVKAVNDFINGKDRKIENLPSLFVEIFLSEDTEKDNFKINGVHNSESRAVNGLKLKIEPNVDYEEEISEIINKGGTFPFEYYSVNYMTFSGASYTSFNRPFRLKYDLIDTSKISTEKSLDTFVKKLYNSQSSIENRNKISHGFKEMSEKFSSKLYSEYNLDENYSDYKLKLDFKDNNDFSKDITAVKNNVRLKDLGKGEQVILGVKSTSIARKDKENKILLIEEPENHLSHNNMHRLIKIIEDTSSEKQSIIATHSDMIASRIDISKLIILNNVNEKNYVKNLNSVDENTIQFFQKAPSNSFLTFILSEKVILVEGDAEYILMEKFFENETGMKPYQKDVSIIACGGKTFKHYLRVAELLNKKVVVITDNDEENKGKVGFVDVTTSYEKFSKNSNIKIFTDDNPQMYTFEVSLYKNNEQFYENKFKSSHMKNGVLSFLLNNKSEAALRLLNCFQNNVISNDYNVPDYINEAIKWIIK